MLDPSSKVLEQSLAGLHYRSFTKIKKFINFIYKKMKIDFINF